MNLQGFTTEKSDYITVNYNKYDIKFICLTETWAKPASVENMTIQGFGLKSHFSRTEFERGGVGLWSKHGVDCDKIDLTLFCVEKHFEVCGVRWLCGRNRFVCIFVCYRSPSGDYEIFEEKLELLLDKFYKPGGHVVLLGDFNLNSLSSINQECFKNLMLYYKLSNRVKGPTRISRTVSTTLDLILTNMNQCKDAMIETNCISDHETVFFNTGINNIPKGTKKLTRLFREDSVQKFCDLLNLENWNFMYSYDLPFQERFSEFYNVYLYYFNDCFPLRYYYFNKDRKSWVTQDIKQSSKNLKDLHLLRRGNPELNLLYKIEYDKHKQLIKNSKKFFYQNKISNSDNTSKTVWSVVSELTGQGSGSCNSADLKIIDGFGNIIEDGGSMADYFNNFFVNAPLEISNKIKAPRKNTLLEHIYNKLELTPFTEEEVALLIKNKIKNKRSAGPDDIPMFLFKQSILASCVPVMTSLINDSFRAGVFPEELKCSKVIPVFKKGDPSLVENYRPIALTSCISKIFEYAILDRLLTHIKSNNILSPRQSGFIPGRSTADAILSFLTEIIQGLEAGERPVGIFCDLSRAFDCVDHAILKERMMTYGITEVAFDLLSSFLGDREQYVQVSTRDQSSQSGRLDVDVGVPQGSVLGPILFLLFVNPIFSEVIYSSLSAYADDTVAIVKPDGALLSEAAANRSLSELHDWFCDSGLYLNLQKTHFLVFKASQRNINTDISLSYHGTKLTKEKSVKFLGITVDETLSWEEHCTSLSSKLSSICFAIRNLKTVLTLNQLINIYYGIVYSRLLYGIEFWGASSFADKVFRSQKKIIRCLAGIGKTDSCVPYFKRLKLLTVPSIFIYEICIFVFRNRETFLTNNFNHEYDTRNQNQFLTKKNRLSKSKLFVLNLGPKMYNELNQEITGCVTLSMFKRKLKEFLIEKCYYNFNTFLEERNVQKI